MAATNLGKVAIHCEGDWSAENAYTKLSIVAYNGGSYMALQAVPSGTALTDTDYWMPISDTRETLIEQLEQHPEWVTTVEDGSIGKQKLTQALASEISKHGTDIDVLDSRVDQILGLPEGSTTADGLLMDICVGWDGRTYDTPGNAVRGQVSQLSDSITEISDVTNLALKESGLVTKDLYFAAGQIRETASPSKTPMLTIPCEPNTKYIVYKGITSARFTIGCLTKLPEAGDVVNLYVTNNTANTLSITTDSNTKYLFVYYAYNEENDKEIYESLTILKGSFAEATAIDKEARKTISEVKEEVESLVEIHKTTNLFNPNDPQSGALLHTFAWDGSVNPASANYRTGIQFLKAGKYAYNTDQAIFGSTKTNVFLFADASVDGELIPTSFLRRLTAISGGDNMPCFFELQSNSYVAFNIGAANYINSFMLAQLPSEAQADNSALDTYFTNFWEFEPYYEPETYLQPDIQIAAVKECVTNPLYQKKIACEGASIMYGHGFTGGYAKLIADRNSMVLVNNAVGGATMATGVYKEGAARHWISTAIASMPQGFDYYIFDGASNDHANNVPFGTPSAVDNYSPALDTTTFAGAFEYACKSLIDNFPEAKKGYILPHRKYTAAWWVSEWKPFIIRTLHKWGIPFLDIEEMAPPIGIVESLKNVYTTDGDGTHPTEEGYRKFYADAVEAWLRTL